MTRFAAVATFDRPVNRAVVDALARSANVIATAEELAIAGDARLDGRSSGDLDAILDAYRDRGERCVDQLHGVFSFAIWDPSRRMLFCARDRFGQRPFYYGHVSGALVVTNTLPALLDLVSNDLDDEAVGDFLIHGLTVDARRTAYRAISRLPPAHRLIASADGIRIERYWSFPIADRPRALRERDAVAELRHHLDVAVKDCARGKVVISMSGGIDSTSVAASLKRSGIAARAVTSVWDELIPDEERAAASIAAQALDLPIDFHVCDRYRLFERWEDPAVRGYEPRDEPLSVVFHDFMRMAAERGEVLLGGWGGDCALCASKQYFFDLLRSGRWLRFLLEGGRYAATRHHLPPLLLRSRMLRAVGMRKDPEGPEWLRPELRVRWNEKTPLLDARAHPWRPEAFAGVMQASWPTIFESFDGGVTRQAIDFAAPFYDVRLLEFLFSLPPMPFFANKDIAREALRGEVPDAIRERPKRTLRGDPSAVLSRSETESWIAIVEHSHALDRFIDRRILCNDLRRDDRGHSESTAVSLARWLRHYDEQQRRRSLHTGSQALPAAAPDGVRIDA